MEMGLRSRHVTPAPSEVNLSYLESLRHSTHCCDKIVQDFRASIIDKYSRFLFPTVFIAFNIMYWTTYIVITSQIKETFPMNL